MKALRLYLGNLFNAIYQVRNFCFSFPFNHWTPWIMQFEYTYSIFPWQIYKWFSSFQSLSRIWPFVTPWTAACQFSLFFTICTSLLKLMSIESGMSSNNLILCHPLLLLPSIFPRSRVFSKESVLHLMWPKYWSFIQYQSFQWIFKDDFI